MRNGHLHTNGKGVTIFTKMEGEWESPPKVEGKWPSVHALKENRRLHQNGRGVVTLARMEEIAVFYEENLDDDKIHFFEKLRLKIKKSLLKRPGKNAK